MLTFNLIMLGTLLAGRHHIFYIIANSTNNNNDNHEDDEKERDWSKCETFHFICDKVDLYRKIVDIPFL